MMHMKGLKLSYTWLTSSVFTTFGQYFKEEHVNVCDGLKLGLKSAGCMLLRSYQIQQIHGASVFPALISVVT